jgi:MFS family permease
MEHRGRFFASRNVMMALVSMLMVPIAGEIIESQAGLRGYQITLAIAFVAGIGASYIFGRIPEARQRAGAVGGLGPQLRSFWHALTANRIFLGFVLIRLLWDMALQIGGPYFSVYQVEVLRSPASVIGILTTMGAFTRMIGLRVWGRLLDRRGAGWVTTVSALLIPMLPIPWLFATQPWHIALSMIPSGFLFAGFEIGTFALLLELLEGENSTQAAAGYASLLAAASIIGPLIGSWVINRVGYLWDFSLSGALRLVGALLFLWLLKPFGSRTTAPSPEAEPCPAV